MDKMSHEVKVSDSTPSGKGKGHRVLKDGSDKSNAVYVGYPKEEAPWPQAKSKNLV